ncbi:ADP-ribose diphosphatase [Testudinibacter sp. TR-2022]|uniref:ADP-ribose diphosphatase n=1 Tax=Testudinibacter sp. TR-2022 TaxID=2585029 RepID=UPI00111A1EAE|nr:ADP-ribose diphosphatase [Testudinibacter sp. TR-2022]TNH04358.1 ADP-ribose diphosphatase [Pasteurellaceae bacterium Phil31]TNH10906.1 ADP-ribose diphosphatase [Testudinibacter sp. TR-2022]TNH11076.1 ADP-ribose diphosphatase [Testudinibacter sp. TR-2022]TNH12356.1 ADP-ribose diphosphatase [Testudinibacter sp. TR-2022]TNH19116.1 ADP-ribose diphosphatase [Testudinibacter sp. TR-2022]
MSINQFSSADLTVEQQDLVYDGFFKLYKIQFRHKLFAGGYSSTVTRELLYKGAASAVIAYDPQRDQVVLVEQVRIGAYVAGSDQSPWLLELIAGMVEQGEQAQQVALREAQEEAGIAIEQIIPALSVWDSPGGVFERIHLFAGKVDATQAGGLHGLEEEHEDIKVHVVSREQAYQWVENGKIDNSIAVIGLQWLQLNYPRLKKLWA